VRADPALEELADFSEGEIAVKNPDEPTIAKLIAIAATLGARVVGDDGEVYERPFHRPVAPKIPLRERLRAWLEKLRPRRKLPLVALPFKVGDRVRDSWRREGIVVSIDLEAEHRLGIVEVRFDSGRVARMFAIAHGLTKTP
jgi:hypothetical protein